MYLFIILNLNEIFCSLYFSFILYGMIVIAGESDITVTHISFVSRRVILVVIYEIVCLVICRYVRVLICRYTIVEISYKAFLLSIILKLLQGTF